MKTILAAVAAASVLASAAPTTAHACSSGFLARSLCKAGVISSSTSQRLDRDHKRLGKPLDVAAKAGAVAGGAILGGPVGAGVAAGGLALHETGDLPRALGQGVGYGLGYGAAKHLLVP